MKFSNLYEPCKQHVTKLVQYEKTLMQCHFFEVLFFQKVPKFWKILLIISLQSRHCPVVSKEKNFITIFQNNTSINELLG